MALKQSLAWLLPLLLLGMAIVAVPLLMFDPKGLPRYQSLSTELQRIRHFNVQLKTDVQHLNLEVQALKTDREAVEKIARDELGMVHDGELVFQFESDH
ncbi:MAG: septum formation initiator family protein [Myxococcales bacterium]|nr:septum formation initiator family protein [Myxococcales bacterium]MCB9707415.1 septum formation initiator family protein [Myxococcales bacterium]